MSDTDTDRHRQWSNLLTTSAQTAGVSTALMGEVLERVRLGAAAAGPGVPRVEITHGSMLLQPQRLSAGSVSKATEALEEAKLLSFLDQRAGSRGGPIVPLQLARDKCVIGIHADHEGGQLKGLLGVLCRLNGQEIAWQEHPLVPCSPGETGDALAQGVADLVKALLEGRPAITAGITRQDLLGVGLEIGAHVRDDEIILAANARDLDHHQVGSRLSEQLDCPVTVENDVNARAMMAYYDGRLHHLDVAVVQVFDGGVGGALIIDGRLYRGAGGLAPEPGHLTVEHRSAAENLPQAAIQRPENKYPTFDDPCSCGTSNVHVDRRAPLNRIRGQLAAKNLGDVDDAVSTRALIPDRDNPEIVRLSNEGAVFRRAGTALGRGLAAMINIVNPGELILRVPNLLANAKPQTSGAQYLAAVEDAANDAFSTGPSDARGGMHRLVVEAVDPSTVPHEGALAAATTVLNGLIEHAREQDGCKIKHPKSRSRRAAGAAA